MAKFCTVLTSALNFLVILIDNWLIDSLSVQSSIEVDLSTEADDLISLFYNIWLIIEFDYSYQY